MRHFPDSCFSALQVHERRNSSHPRRDSLPSGTSGSTKFQQQRFPLECCFDFENNNRQSTELTWYSGVHSYTPTIAAMSAEEHSQPAEGVVLEVDEAVATDSDYGDDLH